MDVEKVLGRPVLDNASASSIFWVIISNKVAFIAPHNCYVKVNFGNRENQAQQRWVKLLTACQAHIWCILKGQKGPMLFGALKNL